MVSKAEGTPQMALSRVGLCYTCLHAKVMESRFAKYPRLPVLHCVGYKGQER
jgi:hypothetical protein